MKDRFIELIDSQNKIKNLFHIGGTQYASYEVIYDVQEFQDWLQEIKLELQEIHDKTHDLFILETINVCGERMQGTHDRRIFNELTAKLNAIRKNIDKYYPEEVDKQSSSVARTMVIKDDNKEPLIFVSHSSKNKESVKLLVELLRAINLQPQRDIFCSSLPGYDIPIEAEDSIYDFLLNRFLNYKIHVLFIHSKEYYESEVCLNEMGAAWALKTTQTSFLLPGFDFEDMKGVVNGDKIAIKLDNDSVEVKDKLNQLRKMLEKEFDLISIQDTIWEQARDSFIEKVNNSSDNSWVAQVI